MTVYDINSVCYTFWFISLLFLNLFGSKWQAWWVLFRLPHLSKCFSVISSVATFNLSAASDLKSKADDILVASEGKEEAEQASNASTDQKNGDCEKPEVGRVVLTILVKQKLKLCRQSKCFHEVCISVFEFYYECIWFSVGFFFHIPQQNFLCNIHIVS